MASAHAYLNIAPLLTKAGLYNQTRCCPLKELHVGKWKYGRWILRCCLSLAEGCVTRCKWTFYYYTLFSFCFPCPFQESEVASLKRSWIVLAKQLLMPAASQNCRRACSGPECHHPTPPADSRNPSSLWCQPRFLEGQHLLGGKKTCPCSNQCMVSLARPCPCPLAPD